MIMTIEQIKENVPAIFTTNPSPKMSNKYVFVPTLEIMENFEKEGWKLSSAKQSGKGIYDVHELRFRNGELPKVGDSIVEAVIKNSHNGLATFSVSSGLHRLICQNGLTVPTSISESFNIRHKNFDITEVKKLTESFAQRLPLIQNSVDKMMNRELTDDEKIEFVNKASALRWKMGKIPSNLSIDKILEPNRDGDVGNSLWKVFNVVQEKFVKGGITYKTTSGRKSGLRSLTGIIAVNQINTRLWEMAEEMC
jgi:hypothetical protein